MNNWFSFFCEGTLKKLLHIHNNASACSWLSNYAMQMSEKIFMLLQM